MIHIESVLEKYNRVYKSYLVDSISFILLYCLFYWLFYIKAQIQIQEEYISIFLPLILVILLIYFKIKSKIDLLKINNFRTSSFIFFVICLSITLPTILAVNYISVLTGKYTTLENISDLPKFEKTKYYKIKNYYVDKSQMEIRKYVSVNSKDKSELFVEIQVVMPIWDNVKNISGEYSSYWICRDYYKTLSNKLTEINKLLQIQKFVDETQLEINQTDFSKITYLELIGNNSNRIRFSNEISKATKYSSQLELFEANFKPFEGRTGNKLFWVFASYICGSIIVFFFILSFDFKDKEVTRYGIIVQHDRI